VASNYQNVFGGTAIYPSDVSYLPLALTEDTVLQWPLEAATGSNLVARIIDVTPTGTFSIFMPDATETAPGQTTLFNNLGPSTITIKSAAGDTLLSILAGTQWQLYLTNSSTTAGSWRTYQMGATTAQAQAATLAGAGLVASGSTLSQSTPVTTFNTNYIAGAPDRAGAYVWTGGVGSYTLPSASSVGNNWFVSVRNGGSGDLTVHPAGSETIDGAATLVLQPGDSTSFVTDATNWFTIGLGRRAVFAFDYTSIDMTGQSSPYTLANSELNRIAYKFVGTLTANMQIVMPATIQQYWVDNETTGGSYTLSIGVSGQVPFITVTRGSRGIFYSDGTQIVNADTASIAFPIAVSQGGTGSTTAGGALINLGGTSVGTALFTAANAAAGRTAITAAVRGANNDITSLTGLTTPLSIAQGGTGTGTAATNGQLLIGNGTGFALSTLTAGANVTITNASGAITIAATGGGGGGGGTVTSIDVSGGSTGLTTSGGPVTTSGTVTLAGTLAVANGGTGQTGTPTNGQLLIGNGSGFTRATITAGTGITVTNGSGVITIAATGGGTGTVTSVAGSGGSTGMTLSGGPITTTGTLTLSGTLSAANGGTGAAGTLTGYAYANGSSPMTASTTIPGSAISGNISGNASTATTAGAVVGAVAFAASAGASPGVSFNGSSTFIVDYHTVGAPSTTGSGASGTWSIGISGNAATATTASTANALNSGNYYSVAGLTIGSGGAGVAFLGGASTYLSFITSQYTLGGAYDFYIGGTGFAPGGWTNTSDYRAKTDIRSLEMNSSPTALIAGLKPITYKLLANGQTYDGFLAHELAEIVPHAVTGEKDALKADGTPKFQAVDNGRIVPLLVAAIQELTGRVASLEAAQARG